MNGYAKESWVTAEITKAATEGKVDLTEYATKEWVENKNYLTEHQDISHLATKDEVTNIDFYNINNNPIVNNGDGKLLFVDENGYIGLQLEENGLYVKDVIADGHTLSQKADKSELSNYATKDEVSDLVDMSVVTELQGKVNTLIDTDVDKSVRDIAVDVLTETLVSETATEAYDTLAEMSAWIKSHPEDASAMNTAIQKNATDITNLDAAYKAADTKVLTDAQEYTDNINFYAIKDNPIVNSEDGTLTFVDESGYIGLKVTEDGLVVKDVVTPEHTLSNKADKTELPTKVSDLTNDSGFITLADIPEVEIPSLDEYVKSEDLPNFDEFAKINDIPNLDGYAKTEDIPSLDGYATEQWVNNKNYATEDDLNNIDYSSINNVPVSEDETGELNIIDESGNVGMKISSEAVYAKDFISGEHKLTEKLDSNNLKTINNESLVGDGNIVVGNIISEEDDSLTIDDVDTNTYVKYVAQTLTEEQKTQARTNINALSQNNIKTINGESIVGTGDIVISGGEDIRYFTEFTLSDFIQACNNADTLTSSGLYNAIINNKIICIPSDTDSGYTIVNSLYEAPNTVDTNNLHIFEISLEYGQRTYTASFNTNDLGRDALEGSVFSLVPQVISLSDPIVEWNDNCIYIISTVVDELIIAFPGSYGTTIRFTSGENTVITFYANAVLWPNGVMPEIEPHTSYELSFCSNTNDGVNAVLVPFKSV